MEGRRIQMINFKNIFSLHYHQKLLEILISLTLLGVFAANIMSPLLMAYILYDVVPHFQIYLWLFAHLFIFFGRIFMAKKLHYFLKIKSKNSTRYLKIIFLLTTFTTALYGVAVWSSLFYGASDLRILTISVIIVSLSAGALATLISIYQLYALYVVFSMTPLIVMLLYHGGDMFILFAFVLSIFTLSTLSAGYRQHLALKNSISLRETFETLFEKSSDGILIIDNGDFVQCNEKAVEMLLYDSKEELLNIHPSELSPQFQPDGRPSDEKAEEMIQLAIENDGNQFEWMHQRSNGENFWVEVNLTPITLNDTNVIYVIWRDITDRKELEEEKEISKKEIEKLNQNLESRVKLEVDKNREKDQLMLRQSRLAQMGEMISMIAHQWRQPLAAISATSATIELKANKNKLENNDIQKKAHAISHYSQHLSKTIDDFRGFFKPNKEKKETTYDAIIASVLRIMEEPLKNKNIHLIQNLNCHETFSTYPGEIKQVILNLIINAEEALLETMAEEPYIQIETYRKKDQYILEVSDNAGGISEKNINYIFDLGLYMSKIIVEEHCDGTLSVTNINKGSLFSIVLHKTYDEKEEYND